MGDVPEKRSEPEDTRAVDALSKSVEEIKAGELQRARSLDKRLVNQDYRLFSLFRTGILRNQYGASQDKLHQRALRLIARSAFYRRVITVLMSIGAGVSGGFISYFLAAQGNSIAKQGMRLEFVKQRHDYLKTLGSHKEACPSKITALSSLLLLFEEEEWFDKSQQSRWAFDGWHFNDCDLDSYRFPKGIPFRHLTFTLGSIDHARFADTELSDCAFQAILDGAHLTFKNVVVRGCDFSGSKLDGSHFESVRFEGETSFGGTTLNGVALCEVNFSEVRTLTQEQLESMVVADGCTSTKPHFGIILPQSRSTHKDQENQKRAPDPVREFSYPSHWGSP